MKKRILALMALAGIVLAGFATTVQAQLGAVGAISPDNGYPIYYQDQGLPAGVPGGARDPLLLSLCLKNVPPVNNPAGGPLCLLPADVDTPTPGVAFPDNYNGTFPDEAFYWSGGADVVTAGGGRGILVLGLEAAFFNGPVIAGDQVVFGRIRFRLDNLVAGATYTITTPYGIFTEVADAAAPGVRDINVTEDIGLVQGDFTVVLGAKIGPYLVPTLFDPANPIVFDADGVAYIADPADLNTVVGSVTPVDHDFGLNSAAGFANFFRVEGPGVGGAGSTSACADPALGPDPSATDDCVETNLFNISGQLAGNFGVQPTRTTYTRNAVDNGRIDVFASSVSGMQLTASIPGRTIQLFEEPLGSGKYFGRFPFNTGARPLPADGIISLTNLTDIPDTTTTSTLVDAVTIQVATFNTTGINPGGTGTLTVRANSSDNSPTTPVTLTVFSDDGTELGPLVDNVVGTFSVFPTGSITVVSSAGGSATQDVVINGPNVVGP